MWCFVCFFLSSRSIASPRARAITQGSFQSLHGAAASDYQNLLHFQNGNNSQLQASNTASNSSPSTQQQYYQQQQHASNVVHQQQPYRQHLHSVTSSDSLSGGNTRSRVNSDSNNSKYNNNNSSKNNGKSNNNNNPPLSSDKKCANGANQNSSVNSNRNLSNNNVNSSSNNLSNNSTNSNNHLRQRHIIELNRQVSELNSKNIEFNRQLSAPAENQNSCNSVYNLYSNHILNNQYSGSPNTNSLNRTKKKRSFKLNGRWVINFSMRNRIYREFIGQSWVELSIHCYQVNKSLNLHYTREHVSSSVAPSMRKIKLRNFGLDRMFKLLFYQVLEARVAIHGAIYEKNCIN